jgi:dsDNA-binding SOS-regulon protein
MTIEAMWPPACIKDVQKLTGCLVMPSQFISRLAKQTLPFLKLLHKSKPFVWTDKVEEVFQEHKRYLTSPLVLIALEPEEPLLLYIAATAEAVNMVLVTKRPEPPQPQETKEASANSSGSQDLDPAGSPEVGVTAGSQLPEASRAPEHQAGPDNTTGSQPPEANSGSSDLKANAPCPPPRGIFGSQEPWALRA